MIYGAASYFAWLAVVVIGVAILPARWRASLLFGASLFALCTAGLRDFAIFVLVTVCAFAIATRGTKRAMWTCVGLLVAHLAGWKIYSYFSQTGDFWGPFGRGLPLGLSFYTLLLIGWAVRSRGRKTDLAELAAHVSFFPSFVAGPLQDWGAWNSQLPPKVRASDVELGLFRIALGLFKKRVIANTLSPFADTVFADPLLYDSPTVAWAAIAFTFQIWADFSAYSDIAIGSARLLGIRLEENFLSPYFSVSLGDFWRRWHRTLGLWLKEFVYLPLKQSGSFEARPYAALLATFLISAVWHGLGSTFLAWGLLHAAFLVLERVLETKGLATAPSWLRWIYVQGIVIVGWILFRSESLHESWEFLSAMSGNGMGRTLPWWGVACASVLCLVLQGGEAAVRRLRVPSWLAGICAGAFIVLTLVFARISQSHDFIYFRF